MKLTPSMQAATKKLIGAPPEVYPLIAIMAIALTGVTAFSLHSFTKNDVVINHHDNIPPWEKDLQRKDLRKFINYKQVPEMPAELKDLKNEMNKSL